MTTNKALQIEISVPSKTFLLGEYVVLNGGPAILLNSTPRFTLKIEQIESKEVECINFGENTAAEKYIEKNSHLFDYLSLNFHDPYQGLGGFGASSALYLLTVILKNYLHNSIFNHQQLLKEYLDLAWNKVGCPPSGSDIISQIYGGITFYHKKVSLIKRIEWPFQNLTFCLIHTENKVNTFKHLEQMPKCNFDHLEENVYSGINALLNRDAVSFCKAVNRFGHELIKHGLVAKHSYELMNSLSNNNMVLAAKGCGALGSDVICAIIKKNVKIEFIQWAKQQNLRIMGIDNLSSDGVSIKFLEEEKPEQVILVDANNRQVGIEDKLVAHKKALLHRAFSIFIFRKKGKTLEILLQQRAAHKYHCGNLWSNACCSHPAPGEDTAESAAKRLKHEMGITTPLNEVAILRYIANVGNGLREHEVDHIFVGEYQDEEINFNPDEVQDVKWISLHELLVELKVNSKNYTPWLGIALRKLLSKKIFYKK